MSSLAPPRFEDGRAMLLGGLRQFHTFDEMAASIPEQWRRFEALGTLPGQIGSTAYGAMCQTQPEQRKLEYMCAVEVEDLKALPADLGRMRVPKARYAVFTHEGNVADIASTWQAIWQEWLPTSGQRPANTPDFERYDERFDAKTGSGIVEIWFPVE